VIKTKIKISQKLLKNKRINKYQLNNLKKKNKNLIQIHNQQIIMMINGIVYLLDKNF